MKKQNDLGFDASVFGLDIGDDVLGSKGIRLERAALGLDRMHETFGIKGTLADKTDLGDWKGEAGIKGTLIEEMGLGDWKGEAGIKGALIEEMGLGDWKGEAGIKGTLVDKTGLGEWKGEAGIKGTLIDEMGLGKWTGEAGIKGTLIDKTSLGEWKGDAASKAMAGFEAAALGLNVRGTFLGIDEVLGLDARLTLTAEYGFATKGSSKMVTQPGTRRRIPHAPPAPDAPPSVVPLSHTATIVVDVPSCWYACHNRSGVQLRGGAPIAVASARMSS